MKRPSFQFYPGDWRRDSALQSCSLVARGMWIEVMCVMHECIPYGKLSVNGQPMTIEQLARIVGESATVTRRIMDELEHAGVFSRDDQGVVFSRRMVKDGHISDVRSAAGKLGGNPDLLKQNDKQNASKTQANAEQSPTPSSSASSSSSKAKSTTGTADAGAGQGATKAENCPQAQIIALYHELLPELPPAREWPEANAAQLRARWRSTPERQSLDWWRKFFGYVHESDFLMGRKTDFQASLGWLVKASNFAKVVNGNYENRGNA